MVTRGRLVHAVGVGHLRRRAGLVLLWSTADFAQLSGDGKSISLERPLKADLLLGHGSKRLARVGGGRAKSHRPAGVCAMACFDRARACAPTIRRLPACPDRANPSADRPIHRAAYGWPGPCRVTFAEKL